MITGTHRYAFIVCTDDRGAVIDKELGGGDVLNGVERRVAVRVCDIDISACKAKY